MKFISSIINDTTKYIVQISLRGSEPMYIREIQNTLHRTSDVSLLILHLNKYTNIILYIL